ncbi:putative negative elongation factor B isoform 2 [Scophthalmus maximus]|uniref:Putative negative elongation factor B isoform 2 n=1 Tax=Scophthalmus maximus TaxID=52904 RepID=A0A2U9BR33_SCOMX|nr:putative negative elongation factor B isoform 2 [Scophthalmus maximus]
MFAGLPELGISNGEDLKETLTNCTEPLKAIDQFQMENGILLPTLQSALPFLDLHGTPRLEFHQSVFDELRDKLMERVATIAEGKEEDRYGKLEELLEKSFPLVKMPSIQPVVMQVLKHLPKVPEKKLKMVMADKELYKVCAVEVKRQIWQDNQALFGDEVSPLLKQYIVEKEAALFSSDLSILHNFFSPSPKMRRQGEVVLKLTQMIGKNVKLYDMVLQFLRTLFLRTRNVHYCTLRAELLMSLHDLDISEICSVDPCHKFTWCLDACIREKFVDGKRARELQGFLDGVKKGQEQVLGDLSMILCDPFACNTLVLSIMRNLQELLSQESLPRDSSDLMLLLRMLSLGQGAWDMIDSQVFKEPRLDLEVVTRFLPAMMSVVVDDHTFTVEQKLPSEEKSSQSYPTALPDAFNRYLQENRVACEMGLYYVLHIAKLRNKNALQRLLPALVETYNDMAFGDIFLHLLTGHLTLLSDEFGTEEFCSVVFDGFLLTSFSSKENVHRHTLRMLLHLQHKVLPSYTETLMKTLEPPKQRRGSVADMGKIQEFEIAFDQNKVVYGPGESISGTVRVRLGQALTCKGKRTPARPRWARGPRALRLPPAGTLKLGEHTFPFKFLIPGNISTSYGEEINNLGGLRGAVARPRFIPSSLPHETQLALSLCSGHSPAAIHSSLGTTSSAVTQQFTYMLVKTGTVVLKAETDMKGYTPGQVIQVTANIHNQSGKSTGHMAASLMQRVTYETKRPTHDARAMVEVEGGVVKAGKEVEWKEQIIIPPLPQSSLAGCELIKIEYYVKVSLKSPDVLLTLPIHIGNVSLDKKRHPSRKRAPTSSAAAEDTPTPADATSAAVPTPTPRPGPKPAPRPTPRPRMSSHQSPSSPPAEYHQGAEGGAPANDGYPNKRQSQLVSPNAFSYAPGLFFPQNQPPSGPSAAPGGFGGPPGATAPYPPESAPGSVPTTLILPPDYGTSAYPQVTTVAVS